MTRTKRRIIFYMLIAVFLMATPLLFAYTLGYSINLIKGTLEKTGSIFIKARPVNTSIFVNNGFVKETSFLSGGALLTSIVPGTYLVRIEKKDYRPWSKPVVVVPEVVTELRDVLLVPNPTVPATSTPEQVAALTAPGQDQNKNIVLDKKGNLIERSGKKERVLTVKVHSFTFTNGSILFLNASGTLSRIDPAANPATSTLETIGTPGFSLSGDKQARFIPALNTDAVAILDAADDLFLLEKQDILRKVTNRVYTVLFDERAQKLIFVRPPGIEVIWLEDNRYQPFQKRDTRESVLRLNEPILDIALWYGDDAHLAIRTNDGIFLTELDGRSGRNSVELVSKKTDELATIPAFPNTIFYRIKQTWHSIEL
ncbi:MAG: hypothetical protein HY006_01640 [Candidatus Sungbacteria bacterium]|nr:hypothetical protein [Candidatus Sungbacteria bacterium]